MSNPSSGNPGINKLANAIAGQIKRQSSTGLSLDFGVILENYALQTNTYPIPLPVTDYVVCRHLTLPSPLTTTDSASVNGQTHRHQVELPAKMQPLQPNDRVLVAWVQNDAVVIDVISSMGAIDVFYLTGG